MRLTSLLLSAALVTAPTAAQAQEIVRVSPAPPPPRIDLTTAQAVSLAGRGPLAYLAPTPEEIRLSRGAKTAIIVGAIVGGILIIAGVIVLAKPHKL